MKAVVFHNVGDIRLDEVKDPKIKQDNDAIVRLTASAICGTDLHMVRGTLPGMVPGTILGHEGVGIVEEVGKNVRNFSPGDRVVVGSTIACGYCSYCRAGFYAQCDEANPNGRAAGTCFFGGPKDSGPIHGMQAEYARVPFANIGMVRVPEEVSDDEAILCSDIFPTGFFAADMARIKHGDTVAVFGCGPVGQFAIASAYYLGAARVIAVDRIASRLDLARKLGAEVINFEKDCPVMTIQELTGKIGVDCAIDAVGVDAEPSHSGPAAKASKKHAAEFKEEVETVAPRRDKDWAPGQAPSQALRWAVEALAKAGTLSVVGVYPSNFEGIPFGKLMNKNIRVYTGNCHHRRYIPKLLSLIESRAVNIDLILSHVEPLKDALEAYRLFNDRQPGWIKVELRPAA